MDSARSPMYRRWIAVALPAAALAGLVFQASALYVLAGAWLALLGVAWCSAHLGWRGLRARRELYPSAFEGDAVTVDVVIENGSRRGAQWVEVGDGFAPGMSDRQMLLEPGPLHAGRRRRLRYQGFCSRHWGTYAVGPLTVGTSDPWGLFHWERTLPEVDDFAVFPRVYEVAGLERLGARAALVPQDASAGRPGQSALYLGVRDYRSGDDVRRIHWPATARRGQPVVKEYEVDLVPYLSIFVDLDRAHRAGTGRKSTLEYVVRSASSLLWSAIRHGHTVQMFGEGEEPLFVPPGVGQLHVTHALYELIRVQQNGSTPLLDVVEQARASLPAGSTAAVISGTIAVEHGRLAELLEGFRTAGVRPLFIFVNSYSFVPVDKWPLPRVETLERARELLFFLQSRGVPAAVLSAEDDLEKEFARPELFGGPA